MAVWLGPAYGGGLELRPDLDAIEALSSERDELWKRIGAAAFLTDAEKRAAVGYADEAEDAGQGEGKFGHQQPRVPAGTTEGGRWTRDGGAGGPSGSNSSLQVVQASPLTTNPPGRQLAPANLPASANIVQVTDDGLQPYDVRPDRPGWHDYLAGPAIVCPVDFNCTIPQMRDYLSRFAVPGQDPSVPVRNNTLHMVVDPRYGFIAGFVRTTISNDGLSIQNQTTWLHVLHSGVARRRAFRQSDGSWAIATHGYGNNWWDFMDWANQSQGPRIFNDVDNAMRAYILRDHGRSKSIANGRPQFEGFHPDRGDAGLGGAQHDAGR